ncbi:hypothetical protein AC578_11116 [Pseudocercospora eumusae]|uniref:Uncharacterized protein n=1 Tax=Pseudocercospora eumusae TaxID=321146 RepID=A0A139H2G4_9PEZI|nr:hypothetical protein AC578_11116 [Pseudocercospora eumusae]
MKTPSPPNSSPPSHHNPETASPSSSSSSTHSPPSSSPESAERSPTSPKSQDPKPSPGGEKLSRSSNSTKTPSPPSTTSKTSPIRLHPEELAFTNGPKSYNPFEKSKHPKHASTTHQRDSLAYAMDNDLITPETRQKYAEQHQWFFRGGDGKTGAMRTHEINVYDSVKAHDGVVQDETAKGDEAARRYRDGRRCRNCWAAFCECA